LPCSLLERTGRFFTSSLPSLVFNDPDGRIRRGTPHIRGQQGPLGDQLEVPAENGQFHGDGKGLVLGQGRFDDELPIGEPGPGQDADTPQALEKGHNVAPDKFPSGGRVVVSKEGIDAIIIVLRSVEHGQDAFIATDQRLTVHGRNEVQAGIRILASGVTEEPVLLLESTPEPCFGHGGEKADHGCDHADFLDKTKLLLENAFRIAVEPDDEPAHHLQAILMQGPHRLGKIYGDVLFLAAFREARRGGRLDTDENLMEIGVAHHAHQFAIPGQIDARFGHELERIAMFLLPGDEPRQKLFHRSDVADEVVVHDKDRAAPAGVIEAGHLTQHLVRGFDPGQAAV